MKEIDITLRIIAIIAPFILAYCLVRYNEWSYKKKELESALQKIGALIQHLKIRYDLFEQHQKSLDIEIKAKKDIINVPDIQILSNSEIYNLIFYFIEIENLYGNLLILEQRCREILKEANSIKSTEKKSKPDKFNHAKYIYLTHIQDVSPHFKSLLDDLTEFKKSEGSSPITKLNIKFSKPMQ